jgi:Raf kinase inhibitor-like YbhB/YbcL family protein
MAGRGDRRPRGRMAAAVAVLACSLLLSGCGLVSGPQPLSEDAPLIMQVSSPVVSARHILPASYTCYGAGESPPVTWSGAPPRTRSFAVVVDDADAPISPFVYWLVVNIGQLTTEIQAGRPPPLAEVADNSNGHARYDAPCPVGATHSYRITVYALNVRYLPRPEAGPQLLPTWTNISPHVLARGEMTVTACPAKGSAGWVQACETVKPGSGT